MVLLSIKPDITILMATCCCLFVLTGYHLSPGLSSFRTVDSRMEILDPEHTPVGLGLDAPWTIRDVECEVSKSLEERPLQWLGEEVCHHVTGGAVLHTHFSFLDAVSDEEVPNVDVSGVLPT